MKAPLALSIILISLSVTPPFYTFLHKSVNEGWEPFFILISWIICVSLSLNLYLFDCSSFLQCHIALECYKEVLWKIQGQGELRCVLMIFLFPMKEIKVIFHSVGKATHLSTIQSNSWIAITCLLKLATCLMFSAMLRLNANASAIHEWLTWLRLPGSEQVNSLS